MKAIREKKHRLPPECYRGRVIVAFTACVKDRIPFFVTRDRFQPMEQLLNLVLERRGCSAEIYLFMPDHAHLLLRGSSEESDLLETMYEFKQRSGFWLRQHHAGVRWQKDFYDHILRREEETKKHIRYILENPVRAGLCNDWNNYPLKGSTVYDLSIW